MTVGKGKYDDALTNALKEVKGKQGVLIVVDGEKGCGFSAQATEGLLKTMPSMLENLAAQLRHDNKELFPE